MKAMPAVIVVAKSPAAGRVKTRLCPPCTPAEAAALAKAALADTLEAALWSDASRVVLALDGDPGAWLPAGVEVIAQRDGDLAARIGGAFADTGEAAILIGMDTPQVTPALIDRAMALLGRGGVDAVLGPASDGGWWIAGLRHPEEAAFEGVPMSTPRTGAEQVRRFRSLGLGIAFMPTLRDVDVIADAYAVAAEAPRTRFAAAVSVLRVPQLAG